MKTVHQMSSLENSWVVPQNKKTSNIVLQTKACRTTFMLIRVHLGTPATETLHLLKHMEAPPICYILQAVLASFARTCAFSSAHAKKQTKARHRLLCKVTDAAGPADVQSERASHLGSDGQLWQSASSAFCFHSSASC